MPIPAPHSVIPTEAQRSKRSGGTLRFRTDQPVILRKRVLREAQASDEGPMHFSPFPEALPPCFGGTPLLALFARGGWVNRGWL
jgi:hypothetical protein